MRRPPRSARFLALALVLAAGCPAREVCVGTCGPCNDERDCPEREVCADGHCREIADVGPRPRDGGALPAGDGGLPADAGAGPRDAGAPDAGPLDAGTTDAGLDDGGTDAGGADDDAGALDGGPVLDPPWWDPAYGRRRRLTLGASVAPLRAGYPARVEIDHASLVALGADPGGADLRVARFDGAAWTEVPRVVAHGSATNAVDTALMLPLVDDIEAGAVDEGYFLYFDGQASAPPPTAGVPARRFASSRVEPEVSTAAAGPLVQNTLSFSPGSADEVWIVVATWSQHSDVAAVNEEPAGRASLRVDGALVEGLSSLSFRQGGLRDKRMGAVLVLTGESDPRAVSLSIEAHQVGTSSGVHDSEILAFLLPETSRAEVARDEARPRATQNVDAGSPAADVAELSFTPTTPGRFVWIVNGFHREGPGGTGSMLRPIRTDGSTAQLSVETYLDAETELFVPLFHVEALALDAAPQRLVVRHETTGVEPIQRQGVVELAFRADVFESCFSAGFDDAAVLSAGQRVLSLDVPAPPGPRDVVLLGTLGHDTRVASLGSGMQVDVLLDGAVVAHDEIAILRTSYRTQMPFARALRTSAAHTLAYEVSVDTGQEARVADGHLLALVYKDPTVVAGPIEQRP